MHILRFAATLLGMSTCMFCSLRLYSGLAGVQSAQHICRASLEYCLLEDISDLAHAVSPATPGMQGWRALQIQFDPDQTGPRLLIEAVDDAGFDAQVIETDR